MWLPHGGLAADVEPVRLHDTAVVVQELSACRLTAGAKREHLGAEVAAR